MGPAIWEMDPLKIQQERDCAAWAVQERELWSMPELLFRGVFHGGFTVPATTRGREHVALTRPKAMLLFFTLQTDD